MLINNKWCYRDPNQTAFSPLFLPPGPGRENEAYKSTPINVHASLLGTSLSFLRLPPRQTPTTKFPRSPTFTASAHCREAANTAMRLHFMVRRSFCELSKTAFIPLYCAIVRPHLEHAMKANAPALRADTNQLEKVQRLATRLVSGLHHVPNQERLRQLNLFSLEHRCLRADPFQT